jgi:hypothetical protein
VCVCVCVCVKGYYTEVITGSQGRGGPG